MKKTLVNYHDLDCCLNDHQQPTQALQVLKLPFYSEPSAKELIHNYLGSNRGLILGHSRQEASWLDIIKQHTNWGFVCAPYLQQDIWHALSANTHDMKVENDPHSKYSTDVDHDNSVCENMRILLVDDDSVNIIVAQRHLVRLGAAVETAKNGLEALEKIDSDNFDMLLMDVNMPKMGGIEATKLIRQQQITDRQGNAIVTVALSGSDFEDEIKECYSAGMNHHLAKPFTESQLKALLVAMKLNPAKKTTNDQT